MVSGFKLLGILPHVEPLYGYLRTPFLPHRFPSVFQRNRRSSRIDGLQVTSRRSSWWSKAKINSIFMLILPKKFFFVLNINMAARVPTTTTTTKNKINIKNAEKSTLHVYAAHFCTGLFAVDFSASIALLLTDCQI